MTPPLTREGCKLVSFWSISAAIAISVGLVLLSVWDVTSFEVGRRLMYSLIALLVGVLLFALVNFLFVLSEEPGAAGSSSLAPPRPLGDALRKAKLSSDEDPSPPLT